jgi:ribonuclease BN (tRNA processing enzyme)
VRVEAFPVQHGSWQAFGFRFTTPDRSVVVSGDTAPVETIVEQSRDCDLLIHEVYAAAGFRTLPPAWQRYHAQVHTSSHELAQIAAQARPGLLVLYHQLFWGTSEQELLYEIQKRYDGPVVSGKDLDVY